MAQLIEYVTPPPRVPLRRSAWGLASLCLGLVIVAGYTALIALQPKLLADSDAIVAAFLAAIVILPSTGLAFGVVAVRQPNRRRGVAIAGVTLNGLLLAYGLWNLGLIILFE